MAVELAAERRRHGAARGEPFDERADVVASFSLPCRRGRMLMWSPLRNTQRTLQVAGEKDLRQVGLDAIRAVRRRDGELRLLARDDRLVVAEPRAEPLRDRQSARRRR
jgi:hypothetical protein